MKWGPLDIPPDLHLGVPVFIGSKMRDAETPKEREDNDRVWTLRCNRMLGEATKDGWT